MLAPLSVRATYTAAKFQRKIKTRPGKKLVKQQIRKNKKSGIRRSNMVGAATTRRTPNTRNDTATVRGRDRIFHLADVSTLTDGGIVFFKQFTPDLIPRLSVLTSAYQRLRFSRLSFRIVAQVPTITPGGYVAAFIGDPNETLPTTQTLEYLVTNTGARTTALWNSTVVNCPKYRLNQTYWAHQPSGPTGVDAADTLRLYSPGSLAVVFEGNTANQKGSMSIEVDWAVTLTGATLEKTVPTPSTDTVRLQYPNDITWNVNGWMDDKLDVTYSDTSVFPCENNTPYDFRPYGLPTGSFISCNPQTMTASLGDDSTDFPAFAAPFMVTHLKLVDMPRTVGTIQIGVPAAFNEKTNQFESIEAGPGTDGWTIVPLTEKTNLIANTQHNTVCLPGTPVFGPLQYLKVVVNTAAGPKFLTPEHLALLSELRPVIPVPALPSYALPSN